MATDDTTPPPPPPTPPDPRDARLRPVFEAAMDAIFIADPTGRFVDVNASACELLRGTREQLLATSIGGIIDPDDLRARPVDFRGMRTEAGVRAPRRVRAFDGTLLHVEVSARALADGYFVAVVRDVTERNAAREALARSEASFRALIESLPVGVAVHRDGRYVYANPAILRLVGASDPRDVLGVPIARFVHPDDVATVRARIAAMRASAAPAPANEERVVRLDGTVALCEISALPVVFQGEPAYLAVVRDVTEMRQIQAQLALTDRMASVGTLVSGVAHEINNPLAFMLLNVESLATALPRVARALGATRGALRAQLGGDDAAARDAVRALLGGAAGDEAWSDPARAEDLAECAREAMTGTRRVQQIVRDLKTFSYVEEGRRGPVRLDAVLDTVLDMAANQLRYRARVERDYAPAHPTVVADEGRLAQVFLNLVLNAAQAIPEGDAERNVVRVRTAVEPGGAAVRVDVEDTGVGIAPEHRSRLFVPFFTTRPVGVGSGLGLFICHNIVRALGGQITVESEPGRGSRFSVVLPACTSEAAPATAAPGDGARPAATMASRRVLVVDDEPLLRASLGTALGASGCAVVACGSGREARELLARDRAFDAVLCDLMMPELSGMDLYDWAVANAPEFAPRFVFMTGGAFTARAHAFVTQTAQPVLDKPFATEQLLAAVDAAAARR